MDSRRILHLLLLVPTLAGVAIALVLFVQAGKTELSDEPASSLAVSAWSGIFDAIPAAMPSEYPPDEEEAPESAEDLNSAQLVSYPLANAFLVSCSFLVIVGAIGLALAAIGAANAKDPTVGEPIWFGLARTGSLIGFTLGSFLIIGFSIAFPGDHFGIFPMISPYAPGQLDSVEYGLAGITEWSDLLYTGSYTLFFAALLLTFCHGGMRTAPAFLIALPTATLFFPIVISWKWGGGWLDMLDSTTYDFAGAALLHWHVGCIAILIGIFLTVARRSGALPTETEKPAANPILLAIGGAGYLLGMIGINAGSSLDADPAIVAPVLQATLAAGITSGVLAVGWSFASPGRPWLRYGVLGTAAGMVAVSGCTDIVGRDGAIVLGVIAGLIIPGLMALLDRLGWADPLSVGMVHGVGGAIGTIAAAFTGQDGEITGTFLGQIVMLVSVPIASIGLTILVLVVATAIGWLARKQHGGAPPPLPGAS